MNLNPFTIIDGILSDYASPRARRLIHSLLLLATVVVGIWLSVDGDWKEALIALGAALYTWANRANTNPDTDEYADVVDEVESPGDGWDDEDEADEPLFP